MDIAVPPLAAINEADFILCLQNLLSYNDVDRRAATVSLEEWEADNDYPTRLIRILQGSQDRTVRMLATTTLQKATNRRWRRSVQGCWNEENKKGIRMALLELLVRETDNPTALQLAVTIGKIARADFPKSWPDLFDTLLSGMQQAQGVLSLQRVMLCLLHVTKALASHRLPMFRRAYYSVAPRVVGVVFVAWRTWCSSLCHRLDTLAPGDDNNKLSVSPEIELALLGTKVLRSLISNGCDLDGTFPEAVRGYFDTCADVMTKIMTWLIGSGSSPDSSPLAALSTKMCKTIWKSVVEVVGENKQGFELHVDQYVGIALSLIGAGPGNISSRVLIFAMIYLKKFVMYKKSRNVDIGISVERATGLTQHLFEAYFPLNQNDMQEWESNPEAYVHDEQLLHWQINLRQCAVEIYLTFLEHFKDQLAPFVLGLLQKVTSGPVTDRQSLLAREAVYLAVGAGNYSLFDHICLAEWFSNVFRTDATTTASELRVLRRRVAYILGQWVDCPPQRAPPPPDTFQVIVHLLNDPDMVVRVEACAALKALLDHCHFHHDQLLPLLQPCTAALFNIASAAEEAETVCSALNILSMLCESFSDVPDALAPLTPHMLTMASQVWDKHNAEEIIRANVLRLLVEMVSYLNLGSENIDATIVPVIRYCATCPSFVLREESVELWLAAMRQSSVATSALLDAFVDLPPLLELDMEVLPSALALLGEYSLIGGKSFFERFGELAVEALKRIHGRVKDVPEIMICDVVEILLRSFGDDAARLLQPLLLICVLAVLSTNETASQFFSQGNVAIPGIGSPNDLCQTPTVVSCYLSVIARVLVQSPQTFGETIQRTVEVFAGDPNSRPPVFGLFLDSWLSCVGNVQPKPIHAKLQALAFAELLGSGAAEVVEPTRFQGLLIEIAERIPEQSEGPDRLMYGFEDDLRRACAEEGVQDPLERTGPARRAAFMADPLVGVDLKATCLAKLNDLSAKIGNERVQALISTVPAAALAPLR